MSAVDTFTLERDADHHDRDRVRATAEDFLGDVTAGFGEVPTALIAFGDAVTVHSPTDASASLYDFMTAACAACVGRDDVYGFAVLYPQEHGARIWTAHEGDGLGTVDHGIRIPQARVFTYVPQSELH